ncbi:hypothetical protein [Georgenia yuyongxinii]
MRRDLELNVPVEVAEEAAEQLASAAERLVQALAANAGNMSLAKMQALLERLQGVVEQASTTGDPRVWDWLITQVDALGTPVVATDERWSQLIGPFYDTPALGRWLGVSRQRLHQRVKAGDLLAVKTRKGRTYYPVWQFTPDRKMVSGVPEVVRGLGERSAYNKALWLKSPWVEFGNRTAIEVLTNGDPADVRAILAEARADGAAWVR